MEEELVVEERFASGSLISGSQACIPTESEDLCSEPSMAAEGDGHARLGNMEVLEDCGSPLATPGGLLFDVVVGLLANVVEEELDSSAKIDITNGFA